MVTRLIEQFRSVSVAINSCSLDTLKAIVDTTCDVPGVESYTIGPAIGISGLYAALRAINRRDPDKRTIYDYHHAGDVDSGRARATLRAVADSGVEAIILSSVYDLGEQRRWLDAAEEQFLEVITGPEAAKPSDTPWEEVADEITAANGLGRKFIRQANANVWLRATDPRRVAAYEAVLLEEGMLDSTLFLARIADRSGQLMVPAPQAVPAVAIVGAAVSDARDIRSAAVQVSQAFVCY